MRRGLWLRGAVLALAAIALAGPGAAQRAPGASAQQTLLREVEDSLRAGRGPVHDLGRLLRPGGVKELEDTARRLEADALQVDFVTVPRGSDNVDTVAEAAYRHLNGDAGNLLIVFDGRRVYGKSLALEGEPRAFEEAAREAAPGFRMYYARGMVQFAEGVRDRIVARRRREVDGVRSRETTSPAAAPRATMPGTTAPTAVYSESAPQRSEGGTLLMVVVVVLALLLAGGVAVAAVRARAGQTGYAQRLRGAEELYGKITLALPDPAPDELQREWLRLDEKLQKVRDPQQGTLAELVDLTDDLKSLDRRLAAK